MRGSSCCCKHFSLRWRGRKRNKESRLKLRRPPCWQPITCVWSWSPPCLSVRAFLVLKHNWTMPFPVWVLLAAWETAVCVLSHNRCHLYPPHSDHISALLVPVQILLFPLTFSHLTFPSTEKTQLALLGCTGRPAQIYMMAEYIFDILTVVKALEDSLMWWKWRSGLSEGKQPLHA